MTSVAGEPRLVVGLGNPGPGYAGNRHNIGAMVLDSLAAEHRWTFRQHRARAALAEGRLGIGGPKVLAAKPSTYMNLSGGPVGALASFFKVSPARILVVHDELDVPFGELRLKQGGGEGGHNGLKDISRALGTRDYLRLRFGIGRPPGRMDPADFVLRISPAQSAANSTCSAPRLLRLSARW